MSKIVIMESLGISAEELAARKAPFEAQGHVFVDYPKTTDPAKLIEEAKDADAMILANMPMPADVLRKCDKLKFIDVAFTGVDHVGLDAAKEKNIAVSNASGYSNNDVLPFKHIVLLFCCRLLLCSLRISVVNFVLKELLSRDERWLR